MFSGVLSPIMFLGASVAFKVNFVSFACYASHHYPKTILGSKTSVCPPCGIGLTFTHFGALLWEFARALTSGPQAHSSLYIFCLSAHPSNVCTNQNVLT